MRHLDVHERTAPLGWDEMQTVLSVQRAGSVAGAARLLGVQHSTVLRRIQDLEARLGLVLFDRRRRGYQPNAHGLRVAEAAMEMERAALAAERALQGADSRLSGRVRLTTSELLATYLLPPLLAGFREALPELTLEIDIDNAAQDLDRRQADLALRATREPPPALFGRRLAQAHTAIFADEHLAAALERSPPARLPWLGHCGALARGPQAQWLEQHLPELQPRLRFSGHIGLARAAAAGAGLAMLPLLAANREPGLRRVAEVRDFPPVGIWLLTHPDLRRNARVRACMDYLAAHLPPALAALEAAQPPSARQVPA